MIYVQQVVQRNQDRVVQPRQMVVDEPAEDRFAPAAFQLECGVVLGEALAEPDRQRYVGIRCNQVGVLVQHHRQAVLPPVVDQQDVVQIAPGHEQARNVHRLALIHRSERRERLVGGKDHHDSGHRRRCDARTEHPPEGFAKALELHGHVTQIAGGHVADDDEVGTVQPAPLRVCRSGIECNSGKRERDEPKQGTRESKHEGLQAAPSYCGPSCSPAARLKSLRSADRRVFGPFAPKFAAQVRHRPCYEGDSGWSRLLMKHVQDEAILLLWVQVVTGTMGLYFLAHLVKH